MSIHLGQPTDNIPHTVVPVELSRATEISAGVTLTTLDGAIIGNAIVIKKIGQTRVWRSDPDSAGIPLDDPKAVELQDVWLIETDFGNQCRLSTDEIHELFGLGFQQDYDNWWDARLELIKRSVEP